MTAARPRASCQTCSSAEGRSSGQRSAREMPVRTRRPGAATGRSGGQGGEVQSPGVGQARGGGQPRRLVQEPEHLRDDAAVDVGVGQQRGYTGRRELGGDRDRDGRAPGRPRRTPHRDQPAGARAGRRVPRRPAAASVARPVERPAPTGTRLGPLVGVRALGQGGGHGRRDLRGRRVGGQDVPNTELAQPGLGSGIAWRVQADDRDPGHREPVQGVPVEAAQLRRQEHGTGRAGRRSGEQVGQVDASAYHRDAGRGPLQAGDEIRLPGSPRDGGEHRNAHDEDPLGTATT